MGSITSALPTAGNAMSVFERSFDVIENNITNANAPGYAEQVQSLTPLPFDPSEGLAGGATPGPLVNTRSEYAGQVVRDHPDLERQPDETRFPTIRTRFRNYFRRARFQRRPYTASSP